MTEETVSGKLLGDRAERIKINNPDNGAICELADMIVMSDKFRQSDMSIIENKIDDQHDLLDTINVKLFGNGEVENSMSWKTSEAKRIAKAALKLAKSNEPNSTKGKTAHMVLVWIGKIAGSVIILAVLGLVINNFI